MRTTIDLPDDLLRRVKARAATQGMKMKDLIAEYVERGLSERLEAAGRARRRSPLPFIAKAASGGPIPSLTNAEIHAILDDEDAENVNRLAGH